MPTWPRPPSSASRGAEAGEPISSSGDCNTVQPTPALSGWVSNASSAASRTLIPPFMSAMPGPFRAPSGRVVTVWKALSPGKTVS